MKTFQLFRIYHSFLLKKWYLLLYIVAVIIALLSTLLVIQHVKQQDAKVNIGIVDEDQSKETKLILSAMGNGKNLGKDIRLKQYNKQHAHQLLQHHKIEGYYIFKHGMTKAFYHTGKLPITVYIYDKQSTQSIAIQQLTNSVYSRLMHTMGGGVAYTILMPDATKHQTFTLLTDLLFTGLNRTGTFEYHPLKLYDTGSYYVITGYLISIFIVFLSLFSILKMNQETELKSRLSLFHFSFEKLTLIRSLFSLFYTALWAVVGYIWILYSLPNTFESYNWPTVAIQLSYYIIMITLWVTLIELISYGWLNYLLKIMLTLLIVLCSGMTVPTIFFKHLFGGLFITQPFSLVTNQMLEITLNNFILETSPLFYSSLVISIIVMAGTLIWRYRHS